MAQSALVRVMCQAAEKAGRALIRDYREVENLQVSTKGPGDFVSRADKNAERIIIEELNYARPDWEILSEEAGGQQAKSERRFIIDPLDGTSNYLHAIPHFAVSIAAEENFRLKAGVVYQPFSGELYYAERGEGAFVLSQGLNRKLQVSNRKNLLQCLIGAYVPFAKSKDEGFDKFLGQLKSVMGATAGVRRMGASSLDLAFLAAGRLDGFWEKGLYPWDIAAGIMIAHEAGAIITHGDGSKISFESLQKLEIIAANPHIHAELLKTINTHD